MKIVFMYHDTCEKTARGYGSLSASKSQEEDCHIRENLQYTTTLITHERSEAKYLPRENPVYSDKSREISVFLSHHSHRLQRMCVYDPCTVFHWELKVFSSQTTLHCCSFLPSPALASINAEISRPHLSGKMAIVNNYFEMILSHLQTSLVPHFCSLHAAAAHGDFPHFSYKLSSVGFVPLHFPYRTEASTVTGAQRTQEGLSLQFGSGL